MSATSSGPVITLPKGGGAVQGIGEKFSPDLHTGTGNFSVPIAVPPGRNGFQPHLNLAYSTGSGNGPFGLGWSLGIPGVSRKTSKGIPLYSAETDVFILSGAEDLVPIPGAPMGGQRYRPRTEGLFAHIDRHGDGTDDHWTVLSKDGLASVYGTPRPPGADSHWRDPAVIADPARPNHIFAWKLTRTTDPFDNRIEYQYERDAVRSEGPHAWDQLYLSQIRYVDHGEPDDPQFLVTIDFAYAGRPDPFSEYRAGFEIRTVRRCKEIVISTHAGVKTLVRTYHLVYLDERGLAANELPQNRVSLLSQIVVEGHDGPLSETLPPLEFGYTRFDPDRRDFFPITGPDLPPGSLARPEYELADLLGNGLPDILEMNGTVRYWPNLGDGRLGLPRPMPTAPAGLSLADKGVQLIDADGDGGLDLMVVTAELAGYYPLRPGGVWDSRSFRSYGQAPTFDLEDPEVRLVDLDGDGVTDAIRSGTRLECFFNDARTGWNGTRRVERRALDVFPNVTFSDPRVKWADMSGDGLQDIVLVYDGNVEYWPSLGRGDWGKRVSMRNSPRFPYGYDPRRILLGDVDGDGLADLVLVEDTSVTLWINQAGNGWSDPINITGTPPLSDMDSVRLADMRGTGVNGVLWSADTSGTARGSLFFLDFTGGAKPYLLAQMDNHRGAVTRVGYAPSTRFYIEDAKRPETRWDTPLPFPVQVVARVEAIDAISGGKLTTEYRYHHGYWDGAEREFRGFGRVDQRDTEVFEDFHGAGLHGDTPFEPVPSRAFSPPTETRTWFHQGPVGDEFGGWREADFSREFWPGDAQVLARPASLTAFLEALPRRVKRDALRTLRGSVLRTELYARDGTVRQDRPYTVTEHLHGLREEAAPTSGEGERPHVFFSHALAERTTHWERGDDPMTQLAFTGDYDEYGQARSQISIAVPRARSYLVAASPGDPYLATQVRTTFAKRDDGERYIVDRAARVTTHEILNDGSESVFILKATIENAAAARRIVGQTLTFYDGPAFEGLPFGQVGDHGAPVRVESLVLTPEILHEAYKSADQVLSPPEEPPYLVPSGAPAWTSEHPAEFRGLLPPLAGYVFQPGGGNSAYETGYYAATDRRRYDVHDSPTGEARGLVKTTREAMGHDTAIQYDAFALLPVETTDPAGLVATATYDYRVLQPKEVVDSNGNRNSLAFTPLGLVASISVLGKPNESRGDVPGKPSSRFVYDFLAFADRGQPVFVRTIKRVHHAKDTDVPLPERDVTIETVEYSDGLGRALQSRSQADHVGFGSQTFGEGVLSASQASPVEDAVGTAAPLGRVIVSGWQTFDNKGRVIEKYEPFFSVGWDYVRPGAGQMGQKATTFYDPRGRPIRAVAPDGSEERVVLGVPVQLATPHEFDPSPWETYTYDANDNAGRTHHDEALGYQDHWDTPRSTVVDCLGRTIAATARLGPDPLADWHVTRFTFDIQGSVLTVTDPLHRLCYRYIYDLARRALRTEQIDAGLRRLIVDAVGNPVEARDSKGALTLHAYDVLKRAVRLWARDASAQPLTLRARTTYGDGPDAGLTTEEAAGRNLLGQPYRQYDEAGRVTFEAYDFKGNLTEKVRQVIGDSALLSVFDPPPPGWDVQPFRVDWQPPGGTALEEHASGLLDAAEYRVSSTHDGLNRLKAVQYPTDTLGERKQFQPGYNRAGSLERVDVDGDTFVERIAYNAKGQRTLIAYGNGVMTRYAHDPVTFRLMRLRTERYVEASLTYHLAGGVLQDLAYEYDLAGNIRTIRDRTPGGGVLNNSDAIDGTDPALAQLLASGDALRRQFTYDPLYRLLSATGRECADIATPRPRDDEPRCGVNSGSLGAPNQDNAPSLTAVYREDYTYDPAGNMTRLKHSAQGATWVRDFGMGGLTPSEWNQQWLSHLTGGGAWGGPPGNRLTHTSDSAPPIPQSHFYDPSGNLVRETSSRHFEWDYTDRLRAYRTQAASSEPSLHAQYLYDGSGQRVKKLLRKQGGALEVTVYVDGLFEHHRRFDLFAPQENATLHIMDNQARVALVRVGSPFPDDKSPAIKFYLGDHLGTTTIVVGDDGLWVNREDCNPYGETVFGGFARKRYRFTGKERDGESGLYFHGARYYAPWLARWTSCDPMGAGGVASLYSYARDNPLSFVDPAGTQEYRPGEEGGSGSGAGGPPPEYLPDEVPEPVETPTLYELIHPEPPPPLETLRDPSGQAMPICSQGRVEPPPLYPEDEARLFMDTLDRMIQDPVATANVLARSTNSSDPRALNKAARASEGPSLYLRALGGAQLNANNMLAAGRPLPPLGELQSGAPITPIGPPPPPLTSMSSRAILQAHATYANATLELQLQAAGPQGRQFLGGMLPMVKGQAIEALTQQLISTNPAAAARFQYLSGASRPDWVPSTPEGADYDFYTGTNYDLFPLNDRQRDAHFGRPYGPTMEAIYYLNPPARAY